MSFREGGKRGGKTKMPNEAQYYFEVLFDLLGNWRARPHEHDEAVDTRRQRLAARMPRALRQFRNEADSMEHDSAADRKAKASRQSQGVLLDAIVSKLLCDNLLLSVKDLENNSYLRQAREKLEVVAEESFPLIDLLWSPGAVDGAVDPILPAMRGNLRLRILELHDVVAVIIKDLRKKDATCGAAETSWSGEVKVTTADIMYCVEYLAAYADHVGISCGVESVTSPSVNDLPDALPRDPDHIQSSPPLIVGNSGVDQQGSAPVDDDRGTSGYCSLM
jgi:hypothetical protein